MSRPILAELKCTRCKERFPRKEFPLIGRGEQRKPICSLCSSRGIPQGSRRDADLRRTYGISATDRDEMIVSQRGKCALCGTNDPSGQGDGFVIDHCHKTGKIRGILCSPCNIALGKFRDSPIILRRAIRYLEARS